jgi:phenylacetyl-CoA:acceptor oxidoreductase 26-kDa subunit
MSYGPNPWQQAHWDWRAAGNFMFGGAGAGLLAFTVLAGVQGLAGSLLVLAGMALIGLGLFCVWLEIGRPWRAINVFRRPGSSWMTREALVAPLVFALGLGVAAGLWAWAPLLLLAALGFVYCQARIVQAGKGIPAWREPLTIWLLVLTGLAEGAGLFWVAGVAPARSMPLLALVFALPVLGRWLVWRAWRQRLGASAVPAALAVIDAAGRGVQWLGGALPIALALLAATGVPGAPLLLAAAGLCAAGAGAYFKFTLITRAAFNQGFRLERLPVRGVPRG